MDISYYWQNKQERAIIAKKHTLDMWKSYSDEIYDCVSKTEVFSYEVINPLNKQKEQSITLTDEDSVSAVFNHQKGRVCVLNFASFKYPGGGFVRGSRAQEECLCHESFLYNVLNEFDKTFYEENREDLNNSLYINRALYSPNIRFFKNDNSCLADVLTCAAPNFSSAYKYNHVSKWENSTVLKQRAEFILNICSKKNVDTLILGAWGCGVFGQDPSEVAILFIEELKNHRDIGNVIFAVIDKESENYKAFKKVL